MEQTISQIQDFLAKNEINLVLNKLRSIFSISDSDLVNDAILIAGQFKKLKSDIRKGILDYEEENLRHNKIMNAILSLIDEIKESPESFEAYRETENQIDESVKEKSNQVFSTEVKDVLFERMAYVKEKNLKIKALWIDDFPGNLIYVSKILSSIGLEIDFAKSSENALEFLKKNKYELVLSDISRHGKNEEGLRFHQKLVTQKINLPTIFFVGHVDKSRGVPPFAFGIAYLINDLIHLVLDVIERNH